MSEWISTKEKLPKVSSKYIVCVKNKNGFSFSIFADWSCEMKAWFGEFGEIKNAVTHWMPLPEPPEEDVNDVLEMPDAFQERRM